VTNTPLSPIAEPDSIAADMLEVDAIVSARLHSGVPLVGQISQYILSAGGKRIRPKLLLLSCRALGCEDKRRLELAAVVEFIHTATLLHDDVVDESSLRRGLATANAAFGNAASVLVGDFLYSRAFQMMVEADSMRVMDVLAEATNVIAEGEVLQLMNMHNADLTQAQYTEVIRSKTAKLFEASARVGAILAMATPAHEAACARYGQALGTAFQMIDDVLDYTGDAELMGKNLGSDLREGKATLPLIAAMERCSPVDAQTVRHAIENGDESQLAAIVSIVQRTGAAQVAMDAASAQTELAVAAALELPDGPCTDFMVHLARQSITRST
jgi:octaprenyl-diphosphate synthase